jgi:hypothetical protein
MGKGIRKNDRGGEFNQSTLYACIGISWWNPFVQIIYAKKNV